jgi:pyruvate dehydrogenase E2 component (dihydrolipoamide acetyltransferase)
MVNPVVMPEFSVRQEKAELVRWLKNEGDRVFLGDPLFEANTDKVRFEMDALVHGVLRKILVREGESALSGQWLAIVAEPEEDISVLVSQAGKQLRESEAPVQKSLEEQFRRRPLRRLFRR